MQPENEQPRRPLLLRPLRPRRDGRTRRFRRGAYLLPSLFTMANMFCGYACIVHSMRATNAADRADQLSTAALFIGFAFVLDALDGRIARMTGTSSAFGVEFDSLADVVSFGVAPAILAFQWGLAPLGRIGWAASFLFVAAAAVRLARFNIQSGSQDKRYFVGLPSPTAASVPAATVFLYPTGFQTNTEALPVLAMMIVPALLMVSTIRYRSFKTLDLQSRRSYPVLFLLALGLALLAAQPQIVLAVMAYTYLASAFIGLAWHRLRKRPPDQGAESHDEPSKDTRAI
jgi:CDP-diacylglycerol--serine O-phosphatidyltransferase